MHGGGGQYGGGRGGSNNRGGGGRGGHFQPGRPSQSKKDTLKFDSEYDFETANEEFKEILSKFDVSKLRVFFTLFFLVMINLSSLLDSRSMPIIIVP